MTKELFIPYELSVIAKDKGFNKECLALYNDKNEPFIPEDSTILLSNSLKKLTAPLYQQIIDWLDLKGIRIHTKNSASGQWNYEIRKWNGDNQIGKWELILNTGNFSSRAKCLTNAIEEAFKLI